MNSDQNKGVYDKLKVTTFYPVFTDIYTTFQNVFTEEVHSENISSTSTHTTSNILQKHNYNF